jgi:hypothetical protein
MVLQLCCPELLLPRWQILVERARGVDGVAAAIFLQQYLLVSGTSLGWQDRPAAYLFSNPGWEASSQRFAQVGPQWKQKGAGIKQPHYATTLPTSHPFLLPQPDSGLRTDHSAIRMHHQHHLLSVFYQYLQISPNMGGIVI